MPYMLRYDLPPSEQEESPFVGGTSDPTTPMQPIETIYVTMSTKDPQRHCHLRLRNVPNYILACLSIALLMTLVVSPDTAMYTTKTLVVPAILLPVRTTTVSVPIIPTGVKTYPATVARGTLTITNGSSIPQFIQAGFLLTSSGGVEVATDYGVTVPVGNGESYGVATVSAYAVVAGSSGNIPAYDITRTYGTDIFMKNLSAFTGGQDAYSVQYVTDQDKQTALARAKAQVEAKQQLVLLLKPCSETTSQQDKQASATFICQPITYHALVGIQVTSIRVQGMSVVLTYKALINADT